MRSVPEGWVMAVWMASPPASATTSTISSLSVATTT
jgi:hypothetical protein